MATKKELKRKILNYAYEQCYLDKAQTIGQFNIQSLCEDLKTEEGPAKYEVYEALHELSLQNIIMKDPYHDTSLFSFTLTTKGRGIAEKQLDIDEYSLRLENFIANEELLDECQDDFNNGKYETAIFSAYRLLEVTVRKKSGLPADTIGTNLMIGAFSPNPKKPGKLRIPTCVIASEETGVLNLFIGAIQSFKNPTSHRIVDYENPRVALQIMVCAELLLDLVKISIKR